MQDLSCFRYQNTTLIKIDLPRSTSSKNPGQHKIFNKSSQFTEYVQHQVLHQIQLRIYKFLLSSLLSQQRYFTISIG